VATAQSFQLQDNSTLANFKAWGQTISNAFTAFGWVKSADTGMVAWGSISSVPAASTFVYEIWVMGDTLQSTNPVFVKIEYGTGASAAIPALAITVGSGSTGAGVLTNAGTRSLFGPGVSGGTSATFECDLSGSTDRFSFVMWRNSTQPVFFAIERSHDTNGNDLATYCNYLVCGAALLTPFCYQQSIFPAASGGPLFYEKFGLTTQTSNATGTFSNSTAIAPFWPFIGKLDNPLLSAVCIKAGDFSDGATFTVSMFGTTHTYLVAKSLPGLWGNQSTNAIGMRYE
jgi:hypothetical protein